MSDNTVSVIIPNWNGIHYLGPCLDSVLAQDVTPHELDVIVVDNASTDGSAELVVTRFPRVRLLRNERNTGFTHAINQGVAAATGEFVFLLNNDTVVRPGVLATLLNYLQHSPPEVAGVQPLLLRATDPDFIDSAGIALEARLRARDDLHGESLVRAPDHPVEIWGLCGGAAIVRRAAFLECGGLDPDFFAEWDDVDFALRARWLGYRFELLPQAVVLHHRSPSSRRDPAAKVARHRRNQIWTMQKSLPRGMALRSILYRLISDVGMIPHYLKHKELGAIVRVWWKVLTHRTAMRRRRKELLRRARRSHREMAALIRTFQKGNPW